MFYGMWNIAQFFLQPSTREKVCPQLSPQGCFQYIDPMYLPETMGGTSTYEPDVDKLQDPPPMMHSILNYIHSDKSSFITQNNNNNHNNTDIDELVVSNKPTNISCLSRSNSQQKLGDYQSISVSVSFNEFDDDQEGDYADSEFDESFCESTSIFSPHGNKGSTPAGNTNNTNIGRLSTFSFHSPRHTEHCPGIMRGWGTKQGHIVRNWKKRFFVLSSSRQVTLFRYYKDESSEEPFGYHLCGELNLNYYRFEHFTRTIRVDENEPEIECNCIEFIGSNSLDKNLLLFIEDQNDYEMWISAIETHLEYRNEMKELARNNNSANDIFSSASLSLLRCNIL